MITRSLLISYAGYPFTPSSLMPDNGLANLAGSLLESGHHTLILDYGTVDMVEKLYPPDLSLKAQKIYRRLIFEKGKKSRATIKDIAVLKYLDYRLNRFRIRAVREIASDIIRKVEELKPDFIGFKLWNGDGFSDSVKIAELIKRSCSGLKIVAGGPQVDIYGSHIYSVTDVFDALVYAEGEEVLPLLAESCVREDSLSRIPNLIYRIGGRLKKTPVQWIRDPDRLPFPVYSPEIYPAMKGDRKIKIIVLDESRGCPNCCAFCIQPIKSGGSLRLKSPERVVEEMKNNVRDFGVTSFRYAGSSTPLKHAVSIADRIIEEGMKVTYSSFGHVGKTSDLAFKTLKKSGCYSIFFGIESGSEEILRRGFGKKIKPGMIRETMLSCRRAGIFTVGSMIFPAPFETEKTEQESFELLRDIRPDSVPIQFPGIYPQTAWRRNPEKYNIRITAKNYELEMMNYKIKLLFPPRYWAPLPYRVNNMKFRQFAGQTTRFGKRLEAAGILTHISDDQALMALHAGYRGKEREFRDRLRLLFAAGDVENIQNLVSTINRSILKPMIGNYK